MDANGVFSALLRLSCRRDLRLDLSPNVSPNLRLRAGLCVLVAAVESDSREAFVELRNLAAGVDKTL
jgi:hypothetical protein